MRGSGRIPRKLVTTSAESLLLVGLAGVGLVVGWFAAGFPATYSGAPGVRRKAAIALVAGSVPGGLGRRFRSSAALPASPGSTADTPLATMP